MNLQIFFFFLGLLLLFFLFRIIRTTQKCKRVLDFSLEEKEESISFLSGLSIYFWKMIEHLSNGLEHYPVLRNLSKKYEKYIKTIETPYKKPIYYVTIKLLIIILFLGFTLLFIGFNYLPNNILLYFLAFLLGDTLPDLFWDYLYIKRVNKMDKSIVSMVHLFSVELKKETTFMDALESTKKKSEGPIKDELKKTLFDLENNVRPSKAFYNFYKRVKIKKIETLAKSLEVGELSNLKLSDVVEEFSKNLVEKNKELQEVKEETEVYEYFFLLCLVIPVLCFFFASSINPYYFEPLFEGWGILIIMGLILLYGVFIYIVRNLLEVRDE